MEYSKDVFGEALYDHFLGKQKSDLLVHTTYGNPEKVPVEGYFYEKDNFSEIELKALSQCKGSVLDIGAGSGKHSLALTNDVCSLDVSSFCCKLMKKRGVRRIVAQDVLKYTAERFDTLLLLQNGIGMVGSIAGLKLFLDHFKLILNNGGQVLFDSSDVSYLYNELNIEKPETQYYGQMLYKYEYNGSVTPSFNWLYIDFVTLCEVAEKKGWETQKIWEDDYDQYLVRLKLF